MNLIQFIDADGTRRVGIVNDASTITPITGTQTIRGLALEAIALGNSLPDYVSSLPAEAGQDYDPILAEGRVLPPVDHPDNAHTLVSGTGLTHLGSAKARNAMHATLSAEETTLTDSMKIFRWGVEGGKPTDGTDPVQPEWFYKGDGSIIVAPGDALELPIYADDGGEEAELAGLYIIADDGTPHRIGFALGNEFSDHVMEKKNYLYLAHSKLRCASIGPEVYIGELPAAFDGTAAISRNGEDIWSAPVPTGEDNMAYTFSGLEHHHFKYDAFRRAGDVHIHFFGAAVLSFGEGIALQDGDVMTVSAPPFHLPLQNPLKKSRAAPAPAVKTL
ncbi:MAG: GguC family protein [Synoicihabitans sp.]